MRKTAPKSRSTETATSLFTATLSTPASTAVEKKMRAGRRIKLVYGSASQSASRNLANAGPSLSFVQTTAGPSLISDLGAAIARQEIHNPCGDSPCFFWNNRRVNKQSSSSSSKLGRTAGIFACMGGLLLFMSVASCQPSLPQARKVNFGTQIKPLFEAQCVNCHQAGALMGNLNLESHSLATKAHPHGQVIKPGDPDHSLIYTVLRLPEEHRQAMPPGGHRIEQDKIDLIRDWILQGAPWPTGEAGAVRPKVDAASPLGKKA